MAYWRMGHGMTNKQFAEILHSLELGHASKETAQIMGVSVRHLQRIVAGETPVPAYAANLAEIIKKYPKAIELLVS